MDHLKTMRWTLCTTGTVLVLLGVLSFFFPMASLLSLAFFIGIGFLVAGINHLVPYYSLRGTSVQPKWLLWQGILDILLGLVFLTQIGLTTLMIPVMLGVWFMVMGVLRLTMSFKLRVAGLKKWWIMMLSGVVLIFCSLAVFSSPLIGALMVTTLLGFIFICAGLMAIAEGKMIYAAEKP